MDSFTKFDDKLPEKMISTAFFKMNIYPMSSTNMLKCVEYIRSQFNGRIS